MAIGDGHSGEGRTMHSWDDDVDVIVRRLHDRFPGKISTNTYECHPFCGPVGDRNGWARRSVDTWGPRGRGDALGGLLSQHVLDFLFTMPGQPLIRHYILGHTLWTSWGGFSTWPADDHSGKLRHVHVTYWPVPLIG
jgi:hypothetical protein